MKPKLTLPILWQEAAKFALAETIFDEPTLFGVTDGKAVGTYLEQKFTGYLRLLYDFTPGNSALGIDIADLDVDIKVTSIRQPQSSCPYKSARQKIYGLGYNLLIFVYNKVDDFINRTSRLEIVHTIFVDKNSTGDYQMTRAIRQIIQNNGNVDDLIALMADRNLPVDEIEAVKIAEELLEKPQNLGYLTISNALQWRLQYNRLIQLADTVDGVFHLR